MRRRRSAAIGAALLSLMALLALAAPMLSQNSPTRQFLDYQYAPPMRPRVMDDDGRLRSPFVYPVRLVDRLQRRYVEDRTVRVPLEWLSSGTIVRASEQYGPWLPLGADALGRDVFARVIGGTRLSLGVAAVGAAGALLLGTAIGALAGYRGGRIDEALMRSADFVLLLPTIYVVLALRAAMPLVLTTSQIFWAVAGVLALAGWPYPARGVRAVVSSERRKQYAEAARAAGAGPARILLRHLLPATGRFLAVQATLLLPAFILAEATLSFVGLGFNEPAPSWGLMLQDAAKAGVMTEAPWLLTPAFAIVIAVLSVQLLAGSRRAGARRAPIQ